MATRLKLEDIIADYRQNGFEAVRGKYGQGAFLEDIVNWRGIRMPSEIVFRYALSMAGEDVCSIEDILRESNSEVRRMMTVFYGPHAFLEALVSKGHGEVILEPQGPEDYQYARLWGVEFEGAKGKILQLINRTKEPGHENLTIEQRRAAGLTDDGYKLYYINVDPTIQYETISQAHDYINAETEESDKEFYDMFGEVAPIKVGYKYIQEA